MPKSAEPSLKEVISTVVKYGYYEIVSIIFLSSLFWVCVGPIITIGAALLALFDTSESIYQNTAPSSERKRVRYFIESVKANIVRGMPFSILIGFVLVNTVWYFSIALTADAIYFILGGLIGIYLWIILIFFLLRLINIMVQENAEWKEGVRSVIASWRQFPNFTVLQISLAVGIMIFSVLVPVVILFLLPCGLVIFEIITYKYLYAKNPQQVLSRYKKQ